jgi:Niemann-Pick C1 protein
MIITPKNTSADGVINKEVIKELWQLQNEIKNIQVTVRNKTYGLKDLCFTPIPNKGCMVDSITEWWQDDINKIESETNVQSHIYNCM